MDSSIIRVVFVALLLDILSFTIILPLLPRLLEFYSQHEASNVNTLLGSLLGIVRQYKSFISSNRTALDQLNDKWDIVLLGGIMGSIFSFLQFLVSPYIGKLSDRIGRRKTLLLTMVGNLISTALWTFARSFNVFLWARIISGLSEGNVQLSIAIIADVTDEKSRSKGLALIGMAFATAFTIGPAVGAYFASFDLSTLSPSLLRYGIYPFSSPALLAFALLIVEFGYIVAYVPETYNLHQSAIRAVNNSKKLETSSQLSDQLENLKTLNWIHAIFLLIFSGMEFTLVFLTFDVFDYTHMQQGKLLGFIGIMSSLIQGGYVRRKAHVIGEKKIVVQGVQSCACGLALFAILAYVQKGVTLLYSGAFLFAITSGTVSNCLTSLASMQCIEQDPRLAKGRALGVFRSYGQLGRAIGPLAACGIYWAYGPVICYGIGSAFMILVTVAIMAYIPQPKKNQ